MWYSVMVEIERSWVQKPTEKIFFKLEPVTIVIGDMTM